MAKYDWQPLEIVHVSPETAKDGTHGLLVIEIDAKAKRARRVFYKLVGDEENG